MNCEQLKQIPMTEILFKLGHTPVSYQNDQFWYESPFREERTPSFHVNGKAWYDFGLGVGGNAIDFLQRYYRLHVVSEVLGYAESLISDLQSSSFHQRKTDNPRQEVCRKTSKIEVKQIRPLEHWGLCGYVLERGINLEIAQKYLMEVSYSSYGRDYLALGFMNGCGGYELRNRTWKGSTKKDIRVLWKEISSQEVLVFEGFMDFLSLLTWLNREEFEQSVIVLNSVALKERAAHVIQAAGIQTVHLYLDHDRAGRAAVTYFQDAFPGRAPDQSSLYAGHKDLNDFLRRRGC